MRSLRRTGVSRSAFLGIALTMGLASAARGPHLVAFGQFWGDVLVLRLNVDFSDAGFLHGTSKIPFGNLVLETSERKT